MFGTNGTSCYPVILHKEVRLTLKYGKTVVEDDRGRDEEGWMGIGDHWWKYEKDTLVEKF